MDQADCGFRYKKSFDDHALDISPVVAITCSSSAGPAAVPAGSVPTAKVVAGVGTSICAGAVAATAWECPGRRVNQIASVPANTTNTPAAIYPPGIVRDAERVSPANPGMLGISGLKRPSGFCCAILLCRATIVDCHRSLASNRVEFPLQALVPVYSRIFLLHCAVSKLSSSICKSNSRKVLVR